MQTNNLDIFISDLIDRRGYAEASSEVKEEIHKDLKQRIDTFVMTRTVAAFSAKELEQFEKMLDEKKSPEELRQFAIDHIPDYTTFLTSTLLTFQDAYLS